MRESQAIIERIRRTGSGWQHVSLAVEDTALEHIQPGQSLLVRTGDNWDPYLRENWIPIDFDDTKRVLIIEHPIRSPYAPGNVISVLGPIGNPFTLRSDVSNLLLVAQDYPPTRLLFLLFWALRRSVAVTLVLTGSAKDYPIVTLPPGLEVILSDDNAQWPEMKETLTWADQVYMVASPAFWKDTFVPVLFATHKVRPLLPEGFLMGIFDLTIPCGTGSCDACMVRSNDGNRRTCVDGAAFDMSKVKIM